MVKNFYSKVASLCPKKEILMHFTGNWMVELAKTILHQKFKQRFLLLIFASFFVFTSLIAQELAPAKPTGQFGGVITATNKGEVLVGDKSSRTGKCYLDIARRITGEEVPIDPIEDNPSLLERISGMFRGGR